MRTRRTSSSRRPAARASWRRRRPWSRRSARCPSPTARSSFADPGHGCIDRSTRQRGRPPVGRRTPVAHRRAWSRRATPPPSARRLAQLPDPLSVDLDPPRATSNSPLRVRSRRASRRHPDAGFARPPLQRPTPLPAALGADSRRGHRRLWRTGHRCGAWPSGRGSAAASPGDVASGGTTTCWQGRPAGTSSRPRAGATRPAANRPGRAARGAAPPPPRTRRPPRRAGRTVRAQRRAPIARRGEDLFEPGGRPPRSGRRSPTARRPSGCARRGRAS